MSVRPFVWLFVSTLWFEPTGLWPFLKVWGIKTVARTWLVILTLLSKVKDFSRSQAVTYAAKLVVGLSRELCKIEMSLKQVTNKKYCAAYLILAVVAVTLSVFESRSRPIVSLFNWGFRIFLHKLTRFRSTKCVARSLCNSRASCCIYKLPV